MNLMLLVLLAVAGSTYAQLDEKGVEVLYHVFCNEDLVELSDLMKECFDELKYDEEATEIQSSCCQGIETPINANAFQGWICAHTPEEFFESVQCQHEKLEESGKMEEYEEQMKPVSECVKNVFSARK